MPQPRILIVRLSAMGDVIHGVPVLCGLRRAMPGAFLGWVVEGRAGDLLEGHPDLDAIIRVPRGWLKSPGAVWKLRRQLRALRFDTSVDLQCLTKSAIAARLSGAGRRIGVAGPDGRELSRWFHNELVDIDANHVIEHYLQIAGPLGVDATRVEFNLPERTEDAQMAETLLAEQGLTGQPFAGQPFAVLNPGAGWPSKYWPIERFAQTAVYLGEKYSTRSVVAWAGAEERAMAESIVANGGDHAMLAPATTMRELAAVCRRAALFIGSDTGPLHLAVAVGTPSISLHGTTRAEWSGAYGPGNRRLQSAYDAGAGSTKTRRHADNRAMQAITVDQVTAACDALLGG